MNILSQMYSWSRKLSLNFEGNPDPKSGQHIRTPDPDHFLLDGDRYIKLHKKCHVHVAQKH